MYSGDLPPYADPEIIMAPEDICGLCGGPGADKIPHPVYWPGERRPTSKYVHAECEDGECGRAHAALTDKEREEFLKTV